MRKILFLIALILFVNASCLFFNGQDSLINTTNAMENRVNTKSKDLTQIILRRQSVRNYTTQKVDKKIINKILILINRAPSAGNLQAYKIYVVNNNEVRNKLAKAALDQGSVYSAPQLLVFVALPDVSAKKYQQRGKELFAIQDATIAAAYAQLIIEYYGLNSVWIGGFKSDKVSTVLGLTSSQTPVAIIPFGYNNENLSRQSKRKPLDQMIKYIN